MSRYGVRFLTTDVFIRYCSDLNIKTNINELECYEKTGIMFPVIRIYYPIKYLKWQLSPLLIFENHLFYLKKKWPNIYRLFYEPSRAPKHYSVFRDFHVVELFDREMGNNPLIQKPSIDNFQDWVSFKVKLEDEQGNKHEKTLVENYYSYWQAYQLQYIQQYPDLYKNKELLEILSSAGIKLQFRPSAPNKSILCGFKNLQPQFNMLSYWISIFCNEQKMAFEHVPEIDNIKELNDEQISVFENNLHLDAIDVQGIFQMDIDKTYSFLYELIDLYDSYRNAEHYKLAEEVSYDIYYLAKLVSHAYGSDWGKITEELGNKFPYWIKNSFIDIYPFTKERHEAQEVLIRCTEKLNKLLADSNFGPSFLPFSITEIDDLLDYCEKEGFYLLFSGLSGTTATQEELATKFRRVNKYNNLKSILSSFEYLIRSIAEKAGIEVTSSTLTPLVEKMVSNEGAAYQLFEKYLNKKCVQVRSLEEFKDKLNKLLSIKELEPTESTYWVRFYLVAILSRNFMVHSYSNDNWFFGDIFGKLLDNAINVLVIFWRKANKEKWV